MVNRASKAGSAQQNQLTVIKDLVNLQVLEICRGKPTGIGRHHCCTPVSDSK